MTGCGLCSPGRWPPCRRNFQKGKERHFIQQLAGLIQEFTHKVIPDTRRDFFALALGKLPAAPFQEEQMEALRRHWFQLLPSPAQAAKIHEGQPSFTCTPLRKLPGLWGKRTRTSWTRDQAIIVTGAWLGMSTPFLGSPWFSAPKLKERKYDESEFG